MKSLAAAGVEPIVCPNFSWPGRITKTRRSTLSQAGSPCSMNGSGCLISSISPEPDTSATAPFSVTNFVAPPNENAGSCVSVPKSRSYLNVNRCTSGP